MFKINFIYNRIFSLIIILGFIFFFSFDTSAAEVLQITNSSTLLIGDQNRNYTVRINCLEVASSDEKSVVKFLRSELPRHSKVNLQPRGSKNGILYAKIISLKDNEDIGNKIISNNLAKSSC
tara:strand:+ start:512 stop:877 length:366 start_codon:yes stop_codon:yes gene_type:complete